jgi:hypothetical protein
MMEKYMRYLFFTLLFSWFSASVFGMDRGLYPVEDGEKVKVVLKLPPKLKADPMRVNYRSSVCKHIRTGSRGHPVELDDFKTMEVIFRLKTESELFYVDVPLDGGGHCKWELSNISFGVAYGDTSEFGEDISYSLPRGQVISFDQRPPLMRSGSVKVVGGDVKITEHYYPWINEEFERGYEKSARLAGEGPTYKNYRAQQAREIYIAAVLHSEFPVYSKAPMVRVGGARKIFTYPDGTSRPENPVKPSFRKLESIRLGLSSEYEKYDKK